MIYIHSINIDIATDHIINTKHHDTKSVLIYTMILYRSIDCLGFLSHISLGDATYLRWSVSMVDPQVMCHIAWSRIHIKSYTSLMCNHRILSATMILAWTGRYLIYQQWVFHLWISIGGMEDSLDSWVCWSVYAVKMSILFHFYKIFQWVFYHPSLVI